MYRDLKMGLVSGMVVALAAVLYLATRPSLSLNHLPRRSAAPGGQSRSRPTYHPNSPEPLPPESASPDFPPREPNVFDWTKFESEDNRKTERFHILEKNQTLSDVARLYYGSAGKWPKIYNANRSTIKDPDRVRPGTKLIIPE